MARISDNRYTTELREFEKAARDYEGLVKNARSSVMTIRPSPFGHGLTLDQFDPVQNDRDVTIVQG